MTCRVELRWAAQIGRLLTQARSGQSDDETEAGMGNGRKDIDLKDDQLYLLEISIASSPLPRGLHILGCFSDQITAGAERDNEKDSSDVSWLGVSQMMHFWEYAGPGVTMGIPALSAKTERECASRRRGLRKRCEERKGDDATTYKPSERVLDWRGTGRVCERMCVHMDGI